MIWRCWKFSYTHLIEYILVTRNFYQPVNKNFENLSKISVFLEKTLTINFNCNSEKNKLLFETFYNKQKSQIDKSLGKEQKTDKK